ncbi:MAG: LPS export ABC transporter ATP-binding protein [Myxococcales bacterium]|nr:LPS export ABC transporter ATP-binding protein [Myxococcales bacterium]
MTHALRARGLVCRLGGRTVLDKVDLDVAQGEVLGLLGPNGAGKTSLMRCVAGLERLEGGRVELDGHAIDGLSVDARARAGLCYLSQQPSVYRALSARRNIELTLEIAKPRESKARRRERAAQLLADFGLEAVAEQRGSTLSGGERRRLELARLLSTDPRVALLDEPLAGLDPIASRDLAREIKKLRTAGVAVLLSDHDVGQALTICDRACILAAGVVVASGTPREVAADDRARRLFFGQNANWEQVWA